MTYAQLPARPKPGVLLYCPTCGGEYSACRWDYFLNPPTATVYCTHGRHSELYPEPTRLELRQVQRTHVPIDLADAEETSR